MSNIDQNLRATASPEQAAAALTAMSKADLIRLEQFARLRTVGLRGVEWEDLLHEAIDRVLAGSRKWPTSIPFVAFMCGTMRSIASEYWRDGPAKHEVLMANLTERRDGDYDLSDEFIDESPSPEREAAARGALKKIVALFEGDEDALTVLNGLANGHTPDEIQNNGSMTRTKYSTTQKRIRRLISRALKENKI